MLIKAMMNNMRMDLGAGKEGPGVGGGLEEEGEGEAIRRNKTPLHMGIGEEGLVRVLGLGEAANEGVEHEGVWGRDGSEEAESIVESVGEGDGGVVEELAGDERVGLKAGFGSKGVDLLQMGEGLAVFEQREAGTGTTSAHNLANECMHASMRS